MPNVKSKKNVKRLGNGNQPSLSSSRGRGSGNGGKRGKGRKAVVDARASIRQRQAGGRGGLRRGAQSGRQAGGISDARQILNSQRGGGRARRGRGSRVFRPTSAAAVLPIGELSLSSPSERNMFSQAVRAAMAPVLAPFLNQAGTAAHTARSSSSAGAGGGGHSNGPCALRVANLAQSVTIHDLNDLFNSFPGFVGASFESGGIAVVTFSQRDSAANAQEEYNNRELDGRTMVIQLDASPATSQQTTGRLGPKKGSA